MLQNNIIAIGDWYIDENWFVLPQKLFHSSHTGDEHYLATISNTGNELINLCAVGGLLYFLKKYFEDDENGYSLNGYGVWNPIDHDVIQCIMCRLHGDKKYLTPHTFMSMREPKIEGEARNCPYLKIPENNDNDGESKEKGTCSFGNNPKINFINLLSEMSPKWNSISTNHVIRCFEGTKGKKPRLKYRFDWASRVEKDDLNIDKIRIIENGPKAIIIEDHGMGVVNEETARGLNKVKGDSTQVFVRTKKTQPIWLKEIDKIDLIVTDHHQAWHLKGHRQWDYDGELGGAALKLLADLMDKKFENGQMVDRGESERVIAVAVLLDNNSVLGCFRDKCFFIKEPLDKKQQLNTGRTTTFYSSLVSQFIQNTPETAIEFVHYCTKARFCAYEWSRLVSKRWEYDSGNNEEKNINKGGKEEEDIYKSIVDKLKRIPEIISESDLGKQSNQTVIKDHRDILKYWEDSSRSKGLIKIGDSHILPMWRAKGTLSDYIVVWGEKRDAINGLITRVADFKEHPNPKQSLSCLLTAAPGWGKSFLARKLADKFDMVFLEYSIAQMPTTTAFVDCLASIASVQNRSKNKVLIFIDEINATIEGHSVYGLLLGPLSDGGFVFEGKSYRLKPAAWIFASSKSLVKDSKEQFDRNKDPKGSDFITRLNGPIINLDYDNNDDTYKLAMSKFRQKLYLVSDIVSEQEPERSINLLDQLYDETDVLGEGEFQNTHDSVPDEGYQSLAGKGEPRPIILYDYLLNNRPAKLQVEQVYLIVNSIIDFWGPITKIQYCVIDLFNKIIAIHGNRSINYFASSFEGIRNGEVTWENIPDMDKNVSLRRHIVLPKEWNRLQSRKKAIERQAKRDKKKKGFIRPDNFVLIETSPNQDFGDNGSE
ncbi:MAG: AAA family ATPase [Candidatus Zixiibacteriota bacterium]